MQGTLALNSTDIIREVRENKKQVVERLRQGFNDKKFELILECLKERSIDIPEDVKNLSMLKKYAKGLDKNLGLEILEVIDNVTKDFSKVIGLLERGSQSAFSKFCTKYLTPVKVIAKGSLVGMAGSTLLTLAPTVGSKLAIAGAMTARGIYRWVKGTDARKKAKIMAEYDEALEKSENTYDENGKLVDTRFSEEMEQFVREFFLERGIKFETNGYLELREKIHELTLEDKKILLNAITAKQDKLPEVEDEKEKTLTERVKESYAGHGAEAIVAGATAGATVAGAINAIDTAIIPAAVVGATTALNTSGGILGKWLAGLVGAGGLVATEKLAGYIPFIGPVLEEGAEMVNASVGMATGGIVGAAIGLGATTVVYLGKKIYKAGKDVVEKRKRLEARKERMELDNELYKEDNQREVIERRLLRKPTPSEKAIVSLITEYIAETGIIFPSNIETITQLETAIRALDSKDKRSVLSELANLSEANINNDSKFMKILKSVGSALYWGTTIGLAGLTIYNIFSPGFLSELSVEVFGNAGNVNGTISSVPNKDRIITDLDPETLAELGIEPGSETMRMYDELCVIFCNGDLTEDQVLALVDPIVAKMSDEQYIQFLEYVQHTSVITNSNAIEHINCVTELMCIERPLEAFSPEATLLELGRIWEGHEISPNMIADEMNNMIDGLTYNEAVALIKYMNENYQVEWGLGDGFKNYVSQEILLKFPDIVLQETSGNPLVQGVADAINSNDVAILTRGHLTDWTNVCECFDANALESLSMPELQARLELLRYYTEGEGLQVGANRLPEILRLLSNEKIEEFVSYLLENMGDKDFAVWDQLVQSLNERVTDINGSREVTQSIVIGAGVVATVMEGVSESRISEDGEAEKENDETSKYARRRAKSTIDISR